MKKSFVEALAELRSASPPPLEIPTIPPPDFQEGDYVILQGNREDVWIIESIRPGNKFWWVMARKNGTRQNFAAGSFTKLERCHHSAPKKSASPPPKAKKKTTGDPVSHLLAEAETIEQIWIIAKLAGLAIPELRAKIGHLSNGLQRMNIGHRLREKQGFDPYSIVPDKEGNFIIKKD